jgi:uracil-DNA glycosylase family 4
MQPKAPCADCKNCPLKDRPFVPSSLPENARMLVIGEAPGADEVRQGQPFVGPSGQLLDHVLKAAGIDPSAVGRTNAVLCRPEGNATPPVAAVAACLPRLAHDINTSGAQILIPLGNTALEAVDELSHKTAGKGGSITSRRGQWYDVAHYRVLPTWHPAYVLRQAGAMSQFSADIRKAVAGLNSRQKGFDTVAVRYIPCNESNKHRVIEHLNHMPAGAWLAFDVESDGLQWYDTPAQQTDPMLALGLGWQKNRVVVIPTEYLQQVDIYRAVQDAMARGKLVAHNGKFDQHILDQPTITANVLLDTMITFDTMLAHYALNEEKGTHGLKQLVSQYLDCDDDYEYRLITSWFEENKIKKEDRKYGMVPKEQLYEYLAIDVAATLELRERLTTDLQAEDLYEWPFSKVLMPVANAIQRVEANGIRVDVPYLQKLRYVLDQRLDALKIPLQKMVSDQVYMWLERGNIRVPKAAWIKDQETYARCIAKCRHDFNPGSWQQVQVVLYDVLRLQHTKKLGFKTDPRSTAEEALLSLQPNDMSGFIEKLFQYRRIEKIRGTYVDNVLRMADVNDRVHINYLVHGTEVNRLSATDGMHGIPRPGDDEYGGAIRGAFIASPGNVLIISDYSQAELRVFAAESREPTMLEAYNNDQDLHDVTAVMIEPGLAEYFKHHFLIDHDGDWTATKACKLCKEIRTTAKNVNFGEVYQGGAYGIWSMLGGKIPLQFVSAVLTIKREKQKVAAAWKMEQFRKARSRGYVQTRFGFKRRFPLITDQNLDEVKKACVHAPIASGAAILTNLSIVALVDQNVIVCGTWHDSIIAECPIEQADSIANLMQSTMVHMGELYYPEVKWKADIEKLPDGSYPTRWYTDIPDFD